MTRANARSRAAFKRSAEPALTPERRKALGLQLLAEIKKGETGRPDIRVFRALVENGADLDLQDQKGCTPLIIALSRCTSYDGGFDARIARRDGNMPEIRRQEDIALFCRQAIPLLLERGADINVTTRFGNALHWALDENDEDSMRLLLDRGVEFEAADAYSLDVMTKAILKKKTAVIALLLDHGAQIDKHAVTDGWTPLMQAISRRDEGSFALLLERGADIHARDNEGRTPLIHATSVSQLPFLQELTKRGADIHARDKKGDTALMHAVRFGAPESMAFLLEQGADAAQKNLRGETLLMQALDFCRYAAKNGGDALRVLEETLALGGAIDEETKIGDTALLYAACFGLMEPAIMLLDRGADILHRNKNGETALMLASPHKDVAAKLLASGADPGQKDEKGRTALFHAIAAGAEETVVFLLAQGAAVHIHDAEGCKVSEYARLKIEEPDYTWNVARDVRQNIHGLIEAAEREYHIAFRAMVERESNVTMQNEVALLKPLVPRAKGRKP